MATLRITSKVLISNIKLSTTNGMPITLADTELRGFSARISPKGRVTWVASKSFGSGKGSTQRVVLGHYPGMGLDQARIEAGQTISRLAKGEAVASLIKQAKEAKVQERQCPSIKNVVGLYLDGRKSDPKRDAESRYEVELARLFNNRIVPELGASTRVNEVTKADIKGLIKTRKDAGKYVAARNLFVLIRPFFDWCISEEYITTNPCAQIEAPSPAQKRQHKLSTQEIVALWSASYSLSHENVPIGTYWRFLLMLIQRRGEIGGMRWRELDIERGHWIIPAARTKNGREHLVPLPRQAIVELKALCVLQGSTLTPRKGEADYVFGKFPSAPFSGFSKAKRELDTAMLAKMREGDTEAVLSDWRAHDLRRTGASLMAGLKANGHKISPFIIEAVLNHTPSSLQATYQVWDLYKYADEKAEALQAWADHLHRMVVNSPSHLVASTPVISNIIAL